VTPAELLALAEENPYTGDAQQVVTLCLGIHQASMELDPATLRAARDEMPISDKIFSKLKVIGSLMTQLTPTQQKTVIKALPDSYNGIHSFCGLTAKELFTAIKSKNITKSTTNRDARDLVKRIRFPVPETQSQNHQPRSQVQYDPTWRTLLTINEDPSQPLTPDDLLKLQQEMTKVLKGYGVEVRTPEKEDTIRDLQSKQRSEQEAFWRTAMEDHLTSDWFQTTPEEIRKQFNIKTIEELWATPLRQFTGFIIRSEGSRSTFWEKWGRAWVCKIQLEQLKTTNKTQRYEYTRRMNEIFIDDTKDGKELNAWRNKMLRGAGFPVA
jgi:hypothetical protein